MVYLSNQSHINYSVIWQFYVLKISYANQIYLHYLALNHLYYNHQIIKMQIQSLLLSFAELSLAPTQNIQREKGLLTYEVMPCEKRQLVLQFKQLYKHRIDYFRKRSFRGADLRKNQLRDMCEVQDKSNVDCLYGVLKRIEKERIRAFQKGYQQKYADHKKIWSPQDWFQLQDNTGKVILQFGKQSMFDGQVINPNKLIFGVVVLIKGNYRKNANRFLVSDMYYPKYPPQRNLLDNIAHPRYLIVASQPSMETMYKLSHFVRNQDNSVNRSLANIVIIGGIKKELTYMKQFDAFLQKISKNVQTFVMPSSGKDRKRIYPITMHNPVIFPKSRSHIGICSNPQVFKGKNNLNMLIGCGQNILDMKANSQTQCQIQLMKVMVKSSHMCPTQAFTMASQPFRQDPLIINEMPHLVIHGKSSQFKSVQFQDEMRQVQLVAIPYDKMVIIDMSNLRSQSKLFSL